MPMHLTHTHMHALFPLLSENPNKCNHITFTLRKKIPPNILLNGMHITQTKHVKYLGLHLDTQLIWKLHTKSIVEKIQKTRRQMHWLTSRKSKLGIKSKLKIYKTIIKPIWTYGISLWGTAAMSHINKLEIIRAKILRTIVFFFYLFIKIHNLSNLDIWWNFLTVKLACWWLPPAGYHPRIS